MRTFTYGYKTEMGHIFQETCHYNIYEIDHEHEEDYREVVITRPESVDEIAILHMHKDLADIFHIEVKNFYTLESYIKSNDIHAEWR